MSLVLCFKVVRGVFGQIMVVGDFEEIGKKADLDEENAYNRVVFFSGLAL